MQYGFMGDVPKATKTQMDRVWHNLFFTKGMDHLALFNTYTTAWLKKTLIFFHISYSQKEKDIFEFS